MVTLQLLSADRHIQTDSYRTNRCLCSLVSTGALRGCTQL